MGEKARLDKVIEDYKLFPSAYHDNPWRCYSECKREIVKMQGEGLVGTDSRSYMDLIEYVTDKLQI